MTRILSRRRRWLANCLFLLTLLVSLPVIGKDPLPSWNETEAKKAILASIESMTTSGGNKFVPPDERIATFDNDGTLWPEQPVVQGAFLVDRVKRLVEKEPALALKSPFKEILEMGLTYFQNAGEKVLLEVLLATHSGMTQKVFDSEVREFFSRARHPTLGRPYQDLGYLPMRELLAHLRSKGFKTFICSGGGIDFMRIVSSDIYGIPPEQVIGSSVKKKFIENGGGSDLWRMSEILAINDKEEKPVNIDLHIGKRPAFAAGNVRSGGDIAMLKYSQDRSGPSFQILINHDDDKREFAYAEAGDTSLTAARERGWLTVSIKNDWREIFSQRSVPTK